VYVPEHNSKPPTPDELAGIVRQACQAAHEWSAVLERIVQMLENKPQRAHDGADTPVQPASPASDEVTTSMQRDCHSSLQKHDMEAYRLREFFGLKQSAVADKLNAEHHTTYSQGQVSRMISRARVHVRAMGLQPAPRHVTAAKSVDPARLDMGPRTDKRRTDGARSKRRPTDA